MAENDSEDGAARDAGPDDDAPAPAGDALVPAGRADDDSGLTADGLMASIVADRDLRARRAVQQRRLILYGAPIVAVLLLVGLAFAYSGPDGDEPDRATPGRSSVPSALPTDGSPPPAPSPSAARARPVSIAAVGDVILGSAPDQLPPDDGAAFFAPVKSLLAADVVTGNLEGSLTSKSATGKCKTPAPAPSPSVSVAPSPSPSTLECVAYRVPPKYGKALADGGFTAVNIANNHLWDYGSTGLSDTRSTLDGLGIRYAGLPGQFTVQQVGGVRVAVVGFAPYGWAANVLNVPAAVRLVRQAAAAADIVIVHMHAGAEGASKTHVRRGAEFYLGENRGDPIAFAHAVVDAGADLVVGHSPHVLRGMEWYRNRLIAYSLGNFAGYGTLARWGPLGVSGVLRVTLRPDGGWSRGTLAPTMLAARGLPAPDPSRRALSAVGDLSATDFGPSAMAVNLDSGELTPPGIGVP